MPEFLRFREEQGRFLDGELIAVAAASESQALARRVGSICG